MLVQQPPVHRLGGARHAIGVVRAGGDARATPRAVRPSDRRATSSVQARLARTCCQTITGMQLSCASAWRAGAGGYVRLGHRRDGQAADGLRRPPVCATARDILGGNGILPITMSPAITSTSKRYTPTRARGHRSSSDRRPRDHRASPRSPAQGGHPSGAAYCAGGSGHRMPTGQLRPPPPATCRPTSTRVRRATGVVAP